MTRLRLKRTVTTLPSGAKVIKQKLVKAPELEWRLQAAAVRAVKAMPGYLDEVPADGLPVGAFTIAADFNAGRRSPQEAVKATATGIAAGDPDLRLYFAGGTPRMIEYKGEKGRLSDDQVKRHALLRALGFTVEVVKASTPEEATDRTLELVKGWLTTPIHLTTTVHIPPIALAA